MSAPLAEEPGDLGPTVADRIRAAIRVVEDFPQPGVRFRDITPLLADGALFAAATDGLAELCRRHGPADLIGGVEARGFLLAGALARRLGLGVLAVRKAGKLPPPTTRRGYALEYGSAEIEIANGAVAGRRVYLIDDVLATGGTLEAAAALLTDGGATLTGMGVLLSLEFLGGSQRLAPIGRPDALLRL